MSFYVDYKSMKTSLSRKSKTARTGARKPPGILLQTLLAPEVAEWVKNRAESSGLTVAAFLRMMLIERMKSAA